MLSKFRLFIKKILYYFLNTTENKDGVIIAGLSKGIHNVTFDGKNTVSNGCNFSGKIHIGYATTLGSNNFFAGDINIGKYCQIGSDVAIHSTNHPIHYLSTYINANLFNGDLVRLKEMKKITIGNDVWIGHNVIIVGDVTIGNGAILAAGSVVTKDVAPFSIVAGVPAKQIKMRFSNQIIKEIEELKWWDLSVDKLEEIKPLFTINFLDKNSIYE